MDRRRAPGRIGSALEMERSDEIAVYDIAIDDVMMYLIDLQIVDRQIVDS
jgi:hypothetical protein